MSRAAAASPAVAVPPPSVATAGGLTFVKDQKVHLRTAIPGPKSRALRAREELHLAPGLQNYAVIAGIVVDEASGCTITDVDGNTLLDLINGIAVGALGHSHPGVVKAIQDQVARASVGSFASTARVELLERLAEHRPAAEVHRVQLYTSGAEAVESALRLARCHTGKFELVGFSGGFHGKTLGAMSLMGSESKRGFGPLALGSHTLPYADCYRCPVNLEYPSCGLACVELGRKQLKATSAGSVAAIIVEPMQGTAGNRVPPDTFLPAVADLAKELDALLIVDEMITGFGRTGLYWGLSHSSVTPSIVTVGKAFGGGFPLTGLLTTEEISRAKPWSNPSGSSSSYGGNPLAAAAGAAALRAIDEEHLVENAKDVGARMLQWLEPLVEEYPFIGFVQGRGLFLRIELVRDKVSKVPLSTKATRFIFNECLKRGLLTMAYAPSVRLQPPLTIDFATAENGLSLLREAFDEALQQRVWEWS